MSRATIAPAFTRPSGIALETAPDISLLRAVGPGSATPRWLAYAAPILDRLLGIAAINRKYQDSGARGLAPLDFASEALRVLGVTPRVLPGDLAGRVPAQGPVLLVSNHPFGGVEALVLAFALRAIRSDVKFLANSALGVFSELRTALIPTNPLATSQRNLRSIRLCQAHLDTGGLLVVFPAGRVSVYHREECRNADGEWNRLVGHLVQQTGSTVLPVFVPGRNSLLFRTVGRIWERARMALLARELLNRRGQTVEVRIGRPIAASDLRDFDVEGIMQVARLMTYVLETDEPSPAASQRRALAPIAAPASRSALADEIASLPAEQRLVQFMNFSVCFAPAPQIPLMLGEIARERERVFRMHDEGSGASRDSDEFDHTYVHLFVWDHTTRTIVGAYRLGHTDELLARKDASGLYLAQMFSFERAFHNSGPPALELGRSFVVPEHQRSFHALYLLWRGIGRYLMAHPRYTRLYGTVSLSRQYSDSAIAALCDTLIEPSNRVRPRHPLTTKLHSEWHRHRQVAGPALTSRLPTLVRALDAEGKDVPVLVRHYQGLAARFHCVGVDPNFNDTPGLLLSVDMTRVPVKLARTFLGDGADGYLAAARVTERRFAMAGGS